MDVFIVDDITTVLVSLLVAVVFFIIVIALIVVILFILTAVLPKAREPEEMGESPKDTDGTTRH